MHRARVPAIPGNFPSPPNAVFSPAATRSCNGTRTRTAKQRRARLERKSAFRKGHVLEGRVCSEGARPKEHECALFCRHCEARTGECRRHADRGVRCGAAVQCWGETRTITDRSDHTTPVASHFSSPLRIARRNAAPGLASPLLPGDPDPAGAARTESPRPSVPPSAPLALASAFPRRGEPGRARGATRAPLHSHRTTVCARSRGCRFLQRACLRDRRCAWR